MSKVDEDICNQASSVPPKKQKTMKIELEEVEVESTGGGFDAGVMVVDWSDDSGQYKRIEFLKKR